MIALAKSNLEAKPGLGLEINRSFLEEASEDAHSKGAAIESQPRFVSGDFSRKSCNLARGNVRGIADHQVYLTIDVNRGERGEEVAMLHDDTVL